MQVSVVIPTYNSAAWLERAFASVLLQQGVSYEVVIVDNNSTDGTLGLMEAIRDRHPDLVRLAYEPRQGSAAARNHGVRLAKGEWIQFLDSDDVLLPQKFTRQLALVREDTDWVIGACVRQDEQGAQAVSLLHDDPWKGLVYNGGVGHTNSNLIRRKILLQVGGQDENLPNGVDNDLYFRLLQDGVNTIADHEPGAIYIDRSGYRLSEIEGSVSRQRMVHLIGEVITWLKMNKPDYYGENGPFYKAALLRAIRVLATQNPQEADDCISRYFPNGIHLSALDSSILPRFACLYPLIGFSMVERLRLRVSGLLPLMVKQRMKGL